MTMLLKLVGALLVCVLLLLLVFSITGLDPRDRTPGLWLKGNLVTAAVADWSFTDKVPTVKVQTRTPFLLPHSVTTNCVAYQGQLYLTSVYPPGVEYPHGRSWNENVARDPHVRIRIGSDLYDRVLTVVSDPAEKAAVLAAKARKYPLQQAPDSARVHVFHVVG